MDTKKKNTLDLFTVIIRPNANIKSRQWWYKKLIIFKKLIKQYLPKKIYLLNKQKSFTLVITKNIEIQNLNKLFRKINKSTDVLSFPAYTATNKNYLGDIVVSVQTAKIQAKKGKISLENELLKLFIHGYLHLLGYDHKKSKEAKLMFLLQDNLLEDLITNI